jgi:hypothetical protein
MLVLRPVLVVLGLVVTLTLTATPAHAAAETCISNRLAERCAALAGQDDTIYANAGIDAQRARVRVRVLRVSLQRLTADGWGTVSTNAPSEKLWLSGGDSISTTLACSSAPIGRYRSTARTQWKLGRDGTVRTGRVTSAALRKVRLCG